MSACHYGFKINRGYIYVLFSNLGHKDIFYKTKCVSAGVFVLLQVYAFLQYLKDRLTKQEFQTMFFLGVSLAAGVVFFCVIYLTYTGWFILSSSE